MPRHQKKKRTIYLETDRLIFYKKRSGGRTRPMTYNIDIKAEDGTIDQHIEFSEDDLFDLADSIDDVCDAISDGTTRPTLV